MSLLIVCRACFKLVKHQCLEITKLIYHVIKSLNQTYTISKHIHIKYSNDHCWIYAPNWFLLPFVKYGKHSFQRIFYFVFWIYFDAYISFKISSIYHCMAPAWYNWGLPRHISIWFMHSVISALIRKCLDT